MLVKASLVIHALVLDIIDINLKTHFRTVFLITKCGNGEGADSVLIYFHPLSSSPFVSQTHVIPNAFFTGELTLVLV